jgi:hypothetical protein
MLGVIMLSVTIQSIVLSVIMVNAIILSVVARNFNRRGRLSTDNLLNTVACFVKSK